MKSPLLMISVFLTYVSTKKLVFAQEERVFHLEHPDGPRKIKTLSEAEALCVQAGAVIAESWRFRDAHLIRHYWHCHPCGWLMFGRNYRGPCNGETEGYYPCASTPEEEGGLYSEGYDTYCYGESYEVPPDAIPINIDAQNRGYVFIIEEGTKNVIETVSLARSQCYKRGADLATMKQVQAAWRNGFSQCNCAWLENFEAKVMNYKLQSCENMNAIIGCSFADISHVLCFMAASLPVRGVNLVDFSKLKDGMYPDGVEAGAQKITGGYVFPSRSSTGDHQTFSIQTAFHTCKDQSAKVATPQQLKEAYENGMHWCDCGFVWSDEVSIELDWLVKGTGQVEFVSRRKNDKCGDVTGMIECPPITNEYDGYNVFCFKDWRLKPPPRAWRIPPGSVQIRGGRVYHVEDRDGRYKITTKWYANKECGRFYTGGVSATKAQLEVAVNHGMTRCACGFVADSDEILMPMYRPIASCGNMTGLLTCPGYYEDSPESGPNWDAWCFISNAELSKTY